MLEMDIRNNEQLSRFETSVDGGIGFLRYQIEKDAVLLLYVEVPMQARGRGVAAELSRAALQFARERNLKPVAVCPYIAAYMRRQPISG
jgi:predicted GNAT family acetyltransferase